MRLATIVDGSVLHPAVVRDERVLPLRTLEAGLRSVRAIAAGGDQALELIAHWVDDQPDRAWCALDEVELAPAVPDPGAIYAIGLNYDLPNVAGAAAAAASRPERPLVYAKLPTSVAASGASLTWDRSLTANVDAEVELGIVIGRPARRVPAEDAMNHVFGYTIVDDVSSRDPWLDGDQWLLGKSMAGFCPVGPWIVTADEISPGPLRLGCTINGVPIQDDSTARMRYSIVEIVAYISRHVALRPGDLIATGTPARLDRPIAPDRHLEPGDAVAAWIEGIGELVTKVG